MTHTDLARAILLDIEKHRSNDGASLARLIRDGARPERRRIPRDDRVTK